MEGEPISIAAFLQSLDGLVIGNPRDCLVIHPGHWPPRESSLHGRPRRDKSSLNREHLPGAVLHNGMLSRCVAITMQTLRSDFEIHSNCGNDKAAFQTVFNIRASMKPGNRLESGTELVTLTAGTLRQAIAALPDSWLRNGFRLKSRPAWTDGAVLYSAYVQGSTWSRWIDIGNFQNFRKGVLPHLKDIGVDILWFNPFNQGRYGVFSYVWEAEVGTPADLKALCEDAKASGIRVLLDLIPHGPSVKQNPYGASLNEQIIQEHPEWISRNADGSFKRWWGGYSMDYAAPGWQNFMADLAVRHLRECGISGWRVDCARYSPDNEMPTDGRIPSQSGTEGALALVRRVHEAMDRERPDTILLGETRTTSHLSQMEYIYDTTLGGDVFPTLRQQDPRTWVPQLKLFLDRDEASFPVAFASGLMHFSENHDTARALRRYGGGTRNALLATCCLIPGLPLLDMDQEQGAGLLLSRLSGIRKRPEFVQGEALFGDTFCSAPDVLTFTRALPERFSVVAIHFGGRAQSVEVVLPSQFRQTAWKCRELLENAPAVRDAGTLRFDIPAYGVRVFAFSPEEQAEQPKPSSPTRQGPVNVSFSNGFPATFQATASRNLLAAMGFVPSHLKIRDGAAENFSQIQDLQRTEQKDGSISFTGKWSNGQTFSASYTQTADALRVRIEQAPAPDAALELCFGNDVDEWSVSALEGELRDNANAWHPLGNEFTLHEKDLWLREIRIMHMLQKSGVHWQADAQPLDPATGQLAFRKGTLWYSVRFSPQTLACVEDLFLRENGTIAPGLTLRIHPGETPLEFTLRANDPPQPPPGLHVCNGCEMRTDGSRHVLQTSHFSLVLNRNLGGAGELRLPDGAPLLRDAQLHSEDAFCTPNRDPEFGITTPCPATSFSNMETSMRLLGDADSLRLAFGGELKRDARIGKSALPRIHYDMDWQVVDAGRQVILNARATPAPRPELSGVLKFEWQIQPHIVFARIPLQGKTEAIRLAGGKKNAVFWDSQKSPLASDSTLELLDKDGITVLRLDKMVLQGAPAVQLGTDSKGVPVLRVILFQGKGISQTETRGFQCVLSVPPH
ncbi:MAG: hypothetical protein IJJ26_07475 [Victivallales bacterium]|nr:hypothetical protein [Victivallales bacterium]